MIDRNTTNMITAFKAIRIIRETLNNYASINEKDTTANLLISLLDATFSDIEADHSSTVRLIDLLTNQGKELQEKLNLKNVNYEKLRTDFNTQNNEIHKLQNIIKDQHDELNIVHDKLKETKEANCLVAKELEDIKRERAMIREEISTLRNELDECDCGQ